MRITRLSVLLLAAAPLLGQPHPAWAQDFFIPGQPKGAPAPKAAPPRTVRPALPAAPVLVGPPAAGGDAPPDESAAAASAGPTPAAQMALPPVPDLPALVKGTSPPAAVIGVMGVPDVMRVSSAAQQVEHMLAERRTKLNQDATKEQAAWREMQQALINDRGKLTPDQGHARERELQERITNAQRQFRERGRLIQDAAQYALAQIERTLVAVIRQVAESRGMNLVLHRAQVALNVNEFDITQQVADQLNKVLPTVIIPPDGAPVPLLTAASGGDTQPPAAAQVAAPAPAAGAPTAGAPTTGAAPKAPAN